MSEAALMFGTRKLSRFSDEEIRVVADRGSREIAA